MEHVGKNIKALRKQKGWNQKRVAEQLEISIPAFSKMETGITDLNMSRVNQIAKLFGIKPTELLAEGMENTAASSAVDVEMLKSRLAAKDEEIISLHAKIIQLYEEASKQVDN